MVRRRFGGGACAQTVFWCLDGACVIQCSQARDFDSFLYPQPEDNYSPFNMSADTISNPLPTGESKSARKKREKKAEAEAAAAAQTQQDSDGQKTPDAADTNGEAFESSYVKELQKYALCRSIP